jgi:hypothetical protein
MNLSTSDLLMVFSLVSSPFTAPVIRPCQIVEHPVLPDAVNSANQSHLATPP